jgi:hypothetical protein
MKDLMRIGTIERLKASEKLCSQGVNITNILKLAIRLGTMSTLCTGSRLID